MIEGDIGGLPVVLERDFADRLMLSWDGGRADLALVPVRHRDDDGEIAFSVGTLLERRYRRGEPEAPGEWDFLDDEPWTWEDGDFGLFVFHVATNTGPIKHRHLIAAHREESWEIAIDDAGVTRTPVVARREHVAWNALTSVRVKFELSGIWAPAAILVLDSPDDVLVVPAPDTIAPSWWEPLTARLRALPGWDDACDAALSDAETYLPDGSADAARCERPIWQPPGV